MNASSPKPRSSPSKYVEITSYGDTSKEKADVVLLCQHDGDLSVLADHPETLLQYKDDPEVLDDFDDLEKDKGSTEITDKTQEKLVELTKGKKRIDVVKVKAKRSEIDPNRRLKEDIGPEGSDSFTHTDPVRNIFDHQAHPKVYEKLNSIHREIITAIKQAMGDLAPDGLFMDIHVMNDNSPKEQVSEEPTIQGLRRFINNLTDPDKQGRKRMVNLLTSFKHQPSIAHKGLTHSLEKKLHDAHIESERNEPYCYVGFTTCSLIAQERPGQVLTIDIPVHEVSKDGESNNINPNLDPSKIQTIARLCAEAISKNLPA
jgi:hypothetical protein